MDTLRAIPESHPLHRLFRGLTEYAFMNELGIGDPPLVRYVAELLASFVPSQSLWRLRDAQGRPWPRWRPWWRRPRRPAMPTAGANAIATSAISPCSGPASIPRPSGSCAGPIRPDALINYQEQGKRSYYLASELSCGQFREFRLPPPERPVRALRLRAVVRPPGVGEVRVGRAAPGAPVRRS